MTVFHELFWAGIKFIIAQKVTVCPLNIAIFNFILLQVWFKNRRARARKIKRAIEKKTSEAKNNENIATEKEKEKVEDSEENIANKWTEEENIANKCHDWFPIWGERKWIWPYDELKSKHESRVKSHAFEQCRFELNNSVRHWMTIDLTSIWTSEMLKNIKFHLSAIPFICLEMQDCAWLQHKTKWINIIFSLWCKFTL